MSGTVVMGQCPFQGVVRGGILAGFWADGFIRNGEIHDPLDWYRSYALRSICDSRWVSRLAHRCSKTGLESFPSPASSVLRPLSWVPVWLRPPLSGLVTCSFTPLLSRTSLPHAWHGF